MRRLLLRLYPASWRVRYGDEFEQVLGDRALGPFDVADVLLGALDAHLHLRGLGAASRHGRGFAMSLRIGGYAATLGGLLLVVGFGINIIDGTDDAWPSIALVAAGTAAVLLGLVGLSAFQARRHPRLIWTAFALPAVGSLLSVVGAIGMSVRGDDPIVAGIAGWDFWFLGMLALIGGSGLFAAASWRAGSVSRSGSALLGAAALGLLVLLANIVGFLPWEPLVSVAFFFVLAAFAVGWILLGLGALRADPPGIAPSAELAS